MATLVQDHVMGSDFMKYHTQSFPLESLRNKSLNFHDSSMYPVKDWVETYIVLWKAFYHDPTNKWKLYRYNVFHFLSMFTKKKKIKKFIERFHPKKICSSRYSLSVCKQFSTCSFHKNTIWLAKIGDRFRYIILFLFICFLLMLSREMNS